MCSIDIDPMCPCGSYKTDTLLCVPLMDEDDQVIGVVQAVNKQPLPGTGFLDDDSDTPVLFTHWDRALLEHVADFAGNELSKLKLFEEMVRCTTPPPPLHVHPPWCSCFRVGGPCSLQRSHTYVSPESGSCPYGEDVRAHAHHFGAV